MLHGVLWRPGRRAGPREVDNGGFVSVVLVTGSAGLIGSEAVRHFAGLGLDVVGIDNDMRARFFGPVVSQATADSTRSDAGLHAARDHAMTPDEGMAQALAAAPRRKTPGPRGDPPRGPPHAATGRPGSLGDLPPEPDAAACPQLTA